MQDFENDKYNVLCNSMLLTEGWDCPSVDCVVVLRPTKVRGLYCQMVGRGTRLAPNKTELLLLDFLWHTERHELCRPAHLICDNEEVARKMTENLSEQAGYPIDIEEAEEKASEDVVAQREEALANQLAEMRTRKRKLVDPLQYEMSIQAQNVQDMFRHSAGSVLRLQTNRKQNLKSSEYSPMKSRVPAKQNLFLTGSKSEELRA